MPGGKPDIRQEDLPKWFWKKADELQFQSDFEYNKVYNFYQCGVCALPHETDKLRPYFKRYHNFIFEERLKSGRKKSINKRVCDCGKLGLFLTKFKVCILCGEQKIGVRLQAGICSDCKKEEGSELPIIFFQNGKEIERPKGKLISNGECIHRNKCLEFAFEYKNINSILYCGNCPNYDKIKVNPMKTRL